MSNPLSRPDAGAPPPPIWMADKVVQMKVGDLKTYDRNNRAHNARSTAKLKASVARFGFVAPILVDGDNVIIAGHGRLEAAKALGLDTVPTVIVDHLSDAEVRALRIADNRLAELSDWDHDALRLEFADLMELNLDGALDFDLDITGFELPEIDIMIAREEPQAEPEESVEGPDTNRPAVTRPGDLWLLGQHRLFCGNSLETASYDRVLDGDDVRMVFTDPPYNVPVQGHVRSGVPPIEVVRLEGSDEPELRRIEEMGSKRPKPEEIVSKLRQVEVLQGQGMSIADAVRQIGVTQQTYYRWRKLYGGMGREQLKRLKELEKENQRLRRAVSDLTLDKLILSEAARGNF